MSIRLPKFRFRTIAIAIITACAAAAVFLWLRGELRLEHFASGGKPPVREVGLDDVRSMGLFHFELHPNDEQYDHAKLAISKPAAIEYPHPFGAADFALIFYQDLYPRLSPDAIRISATGQCDACYNRGLPPRCFWATFQLSAVEQKLLRDALSQLDPFALGDKFVEKGIADGEWWHFYVKADGKMKHIYCHNRFPEPLCEFSNTVRERILKPHAKDLEAGSRVTPNAEMVYGWLKDLE